jgi:hypothetical protein
MKHLRSLLVVTSITASSVAQVTPLGVLHNVDTVGASRGSNPVANFNPVTLFNRFDHENYTGWGYSTTNPGFREITGMHFFWQDQDASTQEAVSMVVYTEDPALPDYPLVSAPIATVGPMYPGPSTGSGAVAFEVTTAFATPILVPSTADVFLGITLHTAWNATITDGESIHMAAGSAGLASGLADLPGASAPAGLSIGGFYEASTLTLAYSAPLRRQWKIEPLLATPGGVATALHYGDTAHAAANTFPGTACMFSSQFPDSASPSLNAGRADDLGMMWRSSGIPDGTLVFFLADISPVFGPEVPLNAYAPGSVGALCLHSATLTVLGFSATASGQASHLIVWPPAARPFLPGLPVAQQAIALDSANGRFLAGPAQISTL